MRILLVEDNPGDARLIQEMLRATPDVSVRQVDTLMSAIDAAQAETYDVILLDLSLPDSTGVDTVLEMASEAPDMPVVVLTGLDDEERGIEAVQAGAQDYLVKSEIDSRLLLRATRYARERYRVDAALRRSEQEYRSLIDDVFDTSMVAVLILDRDFTIVWLNEATEIYFGVEREELIGEDKRALIDSKLKCIFADPDDYASRLLNAYTEGTFTDRFECHVLPEDERKDRWLEHWSQPIRDGMFKGGRIEQYTDITDRKVAEAAEQEQRRFAEALRVTAETLTSTLELDDVLDRILGNIEQVVPHDAANIVMIEDEAMHVERSRGGDVLKTQELLRGRSPLLKAPILKRMQTTKAPVMIDDLQESNLHDSLRPSSEMRSYVGAPIVLQDEVIGFINIFGRERGMFDAEAPKRLSAFASQAAVAIQNARLYQRSQELATLQERQRIARELHDAVSQTLFSSQTMAEAALRQWSKNPERSRSLFADVHRMLSSALAEMRILLLELRPAALTQISLKQLFEQYLQATLTRQNIEIALHMSDIPPLPPAVQIALYRIVQESVNNVTKHAKAKTITVTASTNRGGLELVVQDNGEGFDLNDTKATSLGLEIMRERAGQIGATLTIDSKRGQGTRVVVNWNGTQTE